MHEHPRQDLWSWVEWRADRSLAATLAFDEYDRKLSFGALRDRGERVAAGLVAAGVRPGTRVAWVGPTRIESLLLTVALARLACEQVPLLPAYGRRELSFALEQSRPDALLVWSRSRAQVAEVGASGVQSGQVVDGEYSTDSSVRLTLEFSGRLPEADPSSLPPFVETSGDAPRWIFYTSGTTSHPKGVRHSDATLLAAAVGLERPHAFEPEDRVSLVFPFAHIGGPSLLLSALRVGHALILVERFDPEVVIPALSTYGVTLAGSGPAFWQAYIAAQRAQPERRLFPRLRALIGGGAAKPAHLHAEAIEVLGVEIVSGYGSTECPGLAYNHMGDSAEVLATDGRAVEGVEIRIVDERGSDAALGEVGEVRVRGPMLFRGYLDESENEEAFDSLGWFRTGDIGCLDQAGQLRITGRQKDVIIRKGENISAKEIEDVLGRHAGVAEVSVIGLPDQERGERCCAVIVPRHADRPPSLGDLISLCLDVGLMKQKHPEQLVLVDHLPRNATGKIQKAELRARFSSG